MQALNDVTGGTAAACARVARAANESATAARATAPPFDNKLRLTAAATMIEP